MPTLEQLQAEIDANKARNARVEADKAWETSWTRRLVVLVLNLYSDCNFFLFRSLT